MDGKDVPRLTDEEPPEPEVCAVCGVPAWLNPTEDHEEWVGHKWTPSMGG